MPDATILRKTLRDLRWHIVGWGLGLATLAAILVLLFPTIAEQFEGIELENLGFGEIEDVSDPRQFLQLEFFTWSPILMTVFSIIVGGALLAAEEGRGTLEVLLSQPLSRRGLFLGKLAGAAIAVVVILAIAGIGFLLSAPLVDLKGEVTGGELAIAPFVLLPFAWFVIAATVLAATLTPTRGRAAGLMTFGAAASYVLNIIAGLAESLSWLRFFSPYYYSDTQRVLTDGPVWQHQALLLVAATACVALALVAFERREIGVGRSPLAALLGRERSAGGEAEAAPEPRPARQP
ncbi:MAG: ABC transporter permease subunit [Chloroflexi bacterium]|nr:ABC transporter permease subunit [Chloroflexota bacterium]